MIDRVSIVKGPLEKSDKRCAGRKEVEKSASIDRRTGTGASPVRDNDTGRCRLVNYRRTKFMVVRWIPPFTLQTAFLLLSLVYETHLHLRRVRLRLGYRPG